jgi:hypothetical protein
LDTQIDLIRRKERKKWIWKKNFEGIIISRQPKRSMIERKFEYNRLQERIENFLNIEILINSDVTKSQCKVRYYLPQTREVYLWTGLDSPTRRCSLLSNSLE